MNIFFRTPVIVCIAVLPALLCASGSHAGELPGAIPGNEEEIYGTDAARAKLFDQQSKDREDNLTALRSIRDNKHTKPAMKQFAVLAIDAMMGSRDIPSYLIDPMIRAEERNRDKTIQAFKKELEEHRQKEQSK